jgi:hypothetical protein
VPDARAEELDGQGAGEEASLPSVAEAGKLMTHAEAVITTSMRVDLRILTSVECETLYRWGRAPPAGAGRPYSASFQNQSSDPEPEPSSGPPAPPPIPPPPPPIPPPPEPVLACVLTTLSVLKVCLRQEGSGDPEWHKTHGGSFYAFRGMSSAKKTRVADRPVKR